MIKIAILVSLGVVVTYMITDKNPSESVERRQTETSAYNCFLKNKETMKAPISVQLENEIIHFDQGNFKDRLLGAKAWGVYYRQISNIFFDLALRRHLNQSLDLTIDNPTRELIWSAVTTNEITSKEINEFYQKNKTQFENIKDKDAINASIRKFLDDKKKQIYFEGQQAAILRRNHLRFTSKDDCPPTLSKSDKDLLKTFYKNDRNRKYNILVIANPFCYSCRTMWAKISQFWSQNKENISISVIPIGKEMLAEDLRIPRFLSCLDQTAREDSEKMSIISLLYTTPLSLKNKPSEVIGLVENALSEQGWSKKEYNSCLNKRDKGEAKLAFEEIHHSLSSDMSMVMTINDSLIFEAVTESTIFEFLRQNLR